MERLTTNALLRAITSLRAFIVQWFRKRVHNRANAQDLAQETMLRAIVSAKAGSLVIHEGVNVNAAVKRWLHGVARHALAEWRKHPRHRFEFSNDDEYGENDPPVPDCSARIEARERLRFVRARLTARQGEAIARHAMGETNAEIAAALGWPVGTVASTLRRAKADLEGALRRSTRS